MELPVQSEKTRTPQEAWAMGVAVQANLMTLVVADAKRRGIKPEQHDIIVRAPGAVKHFRETLIDPKTIAGYSDAELHLRLREIWGQFCLMGWLFSINDPSNARSVRQNSDSPSGITFAEVPDN